MDASAHDPGVHLVRHELAALAYRFAKAVRDAPDGFAAFEAGAGVRTPLALVHHMNGVLGYVGITIAGGDVRGRYAHPRHGWEGELDALHAKLAELDAYLAGHPEVPAERLARALQGPLADAMTHVGQLALLRRMAGSPIPAENFYLADVRAGRVGADQAPPVSPDPPR